MSSYEKLRQKNLEDNRRILAELGLVNPFKPLGRVVKKGIKRKAPIDIKPRKKIVIEEDLSNCGSIRGLRRKSARIQGKPVGSEEEWRSVEEEEDDYKPKRVSPNRPKFYGPVPGVEIGTVWNYRIDCSRDGIHRPTVAGIHRGEEGAYSVALSGGYDDNIDLGECFTYTGEGGRDLKGTASNPKNLRTAPQSKDQTLTNGNLALSRNCENGNPVRVIRGYKLDSPFAPEEGYRYDGIYTVEKFWNTTGLSGFGVWKFALRRCKDQAPPPWELIQKDDSPKKTKMVSEDEESAKGDNSSKNSPNHKIDDDTEQNESSETEATEENEVTESSASKEEAVKSAQEDTAQETEKSLQEKEQETTKMESSPKESTKEKEDTLKSQNIETKISQDENNNLGNADRDTVKKLVREMSDSGVESDASGIESSQSSSASV
ncbi:E3 ubiquitin-protein ligase UHRF1-like [Haliotis rubra]|uniref:E3 ubiquitin-protein ligase UHRF1-like n=1 Tax=Haliotis rubra TaxID=36100 RepID=UPI001EE59CF7|nr:E3 ubiquitin-protein ligase UHRF1-like [Haliotis rubra]